jgi:hypothetical protein
MSDIETLLANELLYTGHSPLTRKAFQAALGEIRRLQMLAGGNKAGRDFHVDAASELLAALKDVIDAYDWCSADPVDRGYSSLDSVISDARKLVSA